MKFSDIKTTSDLANYLSISKKNLNYIAYKLTDGNKYTNFSIPKRNGSQRMILSPNLTLKRIQHKIKEGLSEIYNFNNCVEGFVKNKSIVTNANRHIKRKYVFNCDIKDFFPSINFGRVRGIFISYFKFNEKLSTLLANLVCAYNQLPQGSPCSPIIANIICGKMDKELFELARKNNCIYTRYADDITFSTKSKIMSKSICKLDRLNNPIVGNELLSIIQKNGFEINYKKIFLNGRSNRQQVTGLIVNEKINYHRKYINTIRAILHNCDKNGIYQNAKMYFEKHFNKNVNLNDEEKTCLFFSEVIKGKINFLKYINPKESLIFYINQYNDIFEDLNYISSTICNPKYNRDKNIVRIEDNVKMFLGTGFIVENIGIVSCYHVFKESLEDFIYYVDIMGNRKLIDLNKLISDIIEDIIVFPFKSNIKGLSIKPHQRYQLNKSITITGFPNGEKELYTEKCIVQSKGKLFDADIYNVSGSIKWGMSGGPVFDINDNIVGMCRKGGNPNKNDLFDDENGITPGRNIYKFFETNKLL